MRKLLLIMLLFLLAAFPAHAESPRETRDAHEAFVNGAIVVKGEGASPQQGFFTVAQKRIMALRAAKAGAFRETAEILDGVTVSGETTVLNASAESDVVRTSAEGIVKGATVVKEEYDPATGTAAVYLSVPMNGVAAALAPQFSGLVSAVPAYSPGMNASTAGYDGLIVDVRGLKFKPALFNRLLSKNGEALFDPARIGHGTPGGAIAAYTNSMTDARAILTKKGSANPLVVKASGVAASTDAELGPIEAAAVFYSNQNPRFLEAAKVVFVLD